MLSQANPSVEKMVNEESKCIAKMMTQKKRLSPSTKKEVDQNETEQGYNFKDFYKVPNGHSIPPTTSVKCGKRILSPEELTKYVKLKRGKENLNIRQQKQI